MLAGYVIVSIGGVRWLQFVAYWHRFGAGAGLSLIKGVGYHQLFWTFWSHLTDRKSMKLCFCNRRPTQATWFWTGLLHILQQTNNVNVCLLKYLMPNFGLVWDSRSAQILQCCGSIGLTGKVYFYCVFTTSLPCHSTRNMQLISFKE